MKKFVIFLMILLLLVVGFVAFLPYFLPLDKLKPKIVASVKDYTGRNLSISDDIGLTIWPNLALNLKDVALSNANWGKAKNLIEIKEIDVKLKLMPLLEKRVEIDKFILKKPQIFLEVSKIGEKNWDFMPKDGKASPNTEKGGQVYDSKTGTTYTQLPPKFDMNFGKIELIDGSFNYYDASNSTKYAIDKINIALKAKNSNSPVAIDGKFQYRARMVSVNLEFDKLANLIAQKNISGKMAISTPSLVDINMVGKFLLNDNHLMSGKIKTDIKNITALASWLSPTENITVPFSSMALFVDNIKIKTDTEKAIFFTANNIELQLDELKADGRFEFKQKQSAKPYIAAELNLPEPLDIPALLKKLSATSKDVKSNEIAENTDKSIENTGWSDEKIDLSILHSLDGKFTFKHSGIIYKDLKTKSGTAILELNAGKLRFDMPKIDVNAGQMQAKFSLAENAEKTALSFSILADKMPIKPILKSFADIDMLSGAGIFEISANSVGRSQKSIIKNLSGSGKIALKDGRIEGIDLVNIAKMMQKKLAQLNLGDKGTEFASLGASFVIDKGVLNNKDMKLVGPLLDASGAGEVNLAGRSINYRIIPMLVVKNSQISSNAGENIGSKKQGITVPVDIKGAWDNIKIKPDYAAVINNILQNPADIKATGKNIEKQLKQLKDIKNIKDKVKQNPEQILKDIGNSKELLKGLF